MASQRAVVAAVPNYNMAEHLDRLLPQLLRQGYDHVFVLDDGSTDGSVEVAAKYGAGVTVVRHAANRGAAANRNQILTCVAGETLIHFVDSDMEVHTDEVAETARKLAAQYETFGVGVIGGLVCRSDGWQEPFNYGPVFGLRSHLTAGLPRLIDRARTRDQVARALAALSARGMREWPQILTEPTATPTYWVHEGNMLVSAETFRVVGGYDPTMREHETQDLAIRLHRAGVASYFDPSIKLVHHHAHVRGRTRPWQSARASLHLVRKHGLRRYLVDR
ncbi:glycosyltransferase family 2 protein [Mycobacterium yunnanensis]|uniref:glycosyltransferase family 2 protein n=1 Tax=Mycobacterium yunnanensis TaxID=368477 RepID=UPI0021F3AF8D|nr:glycosyltransferase family A protein [Mycobacterium yunnanensis]